MQDYDALDTSEHVGGSHINNNSEALFETRRERGKPRKAGGDSRPEVEWTA